MPVERKEIGIERLLTVAGLMVLLKVSTIFVFTGTPLAPLIGLTARTPGLVVSATADAPVVKELVNGVTRFPSVSRKPLTCTVKVVEGDSKDVGMKVSVTWSLARVTVPATGLPPWVSWIELAPTVKRSIRSLSTATTWVFAGAPVAPLGGLIVVTVGRTVSITLPVVNWLKVPLPLLPATSVKLKIWKL